MSLDTGLVITMSSAENKIRDISFGADKDVNPRVLIGQIKSMTGHTVPVSTLS